VTRTEASAADASQKRRAIAVHAGQSRKFADSYERPEAETYGSCFTYSRKRLDRWLDRYLPASGTGLRLLDVGCGTGHHLQHLRRRGFAVAGVDGADEMLREARRRNPGALIQQADVEQLPIATGSFDFVLCIEVLRYLPDPLPCLRELARVLKPGGACLATATPLLNLNGYWLVNRLAGLVPIPHLTRLRQFFVTSGRLRANLSEAGFARADLHGVYLGPVNWVERLAPRALPPLLRKWERWDAALADHGPFRELSNMFFVHAIRE
jgi:2-polyprenyl-3-methyl-5-hydroxy-6-metoxy-1,4-benzoquinol methylase